MSIRFNGIEFTGRAGTVMWCGENLMRGDKDVETKRTTQLIIMGRKLSWKTCKIQDCCNSR